MQILLSFAAIFASKQDWVRDLMYFHLKLRNVKFLRLEKTNWEDPPHSHADQYQISIPLAGRLIGCVDKKKQILLPGSSMIANPYATHQHQTDREPCLFLIVGLNEKAFNQWAREKHGVEKEIEFREQQTLFPNELQKKMRHWFQSHVFYSEFANTGLDELEDEIYQYFFEVLAGNYNAKGAEQNRSPGVSDIYMRQVLDYLHSHYHEEIEINTLAKLAKLSKYHFIRSFKKLTQFTPYQYLLKLRVEKGKELLRNSTKSVTEIALDLGFASPSQFYRAFVREEKCSPQEYRQRI